MLTTDQLKQVVHQKGLSKTDISLLCVAAGNGPIRTADVRNMAIRVGVKKAKDINFSALLSAAKGKVFKSSDGWEFTTEGTKHIAEITMQVLSVSPAAAQANSLRDSLPNIKNEDAKAFITEAIVCAEQSLLRAAVVFSWVGAVSLLQNHVVKGYLSKFNAEALKRDSKWIAARNADDLGRMKEGTFLEIVTAISVIGKNVKQELDKCLKLRNACGHPTSLKIGSNMVAAHLEILTLNVFAVYV